MTRRLRRRVRAWKQRLYNVAAIEEHTGTGDTDEIHSKDEALAVEPDPGAKSSSGSADSGPELLGITDAGGTMDISAVSGSRAGRRGSTQNVAREDDTKGMTEEQIKARRASGLVSGGTTAAPRKGKASRR